MIVPWKQLSREALEGLIEEFVTRHGTDTGYTGGSLGKDIDMVKAQLRSGDVVIVFDEATRTANLVSKDSLQGVIE